MRKRTKFLLAAVFAGGIGGAIAAAANRRRTGDILPMFVGDFVDSVSEIWSELQDQFIATQVARNTSEATSALAQVFVQKVNGAGWSVASRDITPTVSVAGGSAILVPNQESFRVLAYRNTAGVWTIFHQYDMDLDGVSYSDFESLVAKRGLNPADGTDDMSDSLTHPAV